MLLFSLFESLRNNGKALIEASSLDSIDWAELSPLII